MAAEWPVRGALAIRGSSPSRPCSVRFVQRPYTGAALGEEGAQETIRTAGEPGKASARAPRFRGAGGKSVMLQTSRTSHA